MTTRLTIAIGAMLVLLIAACGGDASPPTATLLPPEDYREAIASEDAFVVNVHIPYEGEVPGTDAFIPFDDIASYAGHFPLIKTRPSTSTAAPAV